MPRPYHLTLNLMLRNRSLRATGLALWLLCAGLVACSQPAPALLGCEPGARAEAASLRLLVSFHQPTVGDAPAVLAQLQAESGACVRYVSTVSPTLHAYALSPPPDLPTATARLLRWPAIKAVEADALVRRH